jgi:hypothetical protein
VLVELGVVEQRFDAVKEVLDGEGTVTEVARRYGVTRQSLHNWLRRYRERGMAGLVDRSKRPRSCPHRTPARAELRVSSAATIPAGDRGGSPRKGADPVPSRSSIYRILVRWARRAPIRTGAAQVWTGTQLLIWGGYTGLDEQNVVASSLVFDAAEQTWRLTAPAPLEPRALRASAWTGSELLVWGGWSGTYGYEFAEGVPRRRGGLRPVTDSWRMPTGALLHTPRTSPPVR